MTNVYARMILYILSPILASLVAMLPGWGVAYADGVLTIDTEALVGAVVAAMGVSGAVFARWGIK